jgi:hypothetical protein
MSANRTAWASVPGAAQELDLLRADHHQDRLAGVYPVADEGAHAGDELGEAGRT